MKPLKAGIETISDWQVNEIELNHHPSGEITTILDWCSQCVTIVALISLYAIRRFVLSIFGRSGYICIPLFTPIFIHLYINIFLSMSHFHHRWYHDQYHWTHHATIDIEVVAIIWCVDWPSCQCPTLIS